MHQTIVVGFKDDAQGADALALARSLSVAGSDVVLASVLEDAHPGSTPSLRKPPIGEADGHVANQVADWPYGTRLSVRVISAGSASEALHTLAEDEAADLLVLGSAQIGPAGRVVIGTTAERLLHGAPCAVAVAPRGYAAQAGRVEAASKPATLRTGASPT